MSVRFRLPDLGEGVAETEIIRWLVEPGETVAEDQPMVEVATDKANVEIPAPASGVVTGVFAQAGERVPVGSVIVEIGTGDESDSNVGAPVEIPAASEGPSHARARRNGAPPARARAGAAKVRATPLVRRLASERGVDLGAIAGTGPGGRITEQDVLAAAGTGPVVAGGTAGVAIASLLMLDEVVLAQDGSVDLAGLLDAVLVELTVAPWVAVDGAHGAAGVEGAETTIDVTTRGGERRTLTVALASGDESPLAASTSVQAGSAGEVRLHRPVERPVAGGSGVSVARVAYLTLTADAAIAPREVGASFLRGVARRLG